MIVIREWDHKEFTKFQLNDYSNSNLEIGCGNGLFLTQIAKNNKNQFFFGIDIKAKCINKSKKKIERENLTNVILINGDIFTSLTNFFYPDFFNNIYINFPDPWFKRKHFKKRIIQKSMIEKYYQYLKNNGNIYFITDNIEYRDLAIDLFIKSNLFVPYYNYPYYDKKPDDYPLSLYEEKWLKENRTISFSIFMKK